MMAAAFNRASVGFLFCVAAAASVPAQAQNYDSAGLLRFGVFGQGAWNNFDIERPAGLGSTHADGFGGGGTFGYDLLLSSGWLIGFESDIAAGDWTSTRAGRDLNVDYMSTFRAPAGSYVRPDLFIYATGGFALLGVQHKGLFDTILGQRLKSSDTLSGWTVGAGVEYEWAREMVFFGEYMFASFDNFTVREGNGGSFTTSEDQSVLRLGVKFKIGYDFREGPVW